MADELGRAWEIGPRLAEWAREIHCGGAEGRSLETLQREDASLWARNTAQADDEFAWPGGETYRAFRARVLAGLDSVAGSHPGRRIAVVTHAGAIAQVLGAAPVSTAVGVA